MKLFFTFLLVIVCMNIHAQDTIFVKTTDKHTLQPVPFVTIIDEASRLITTTDAQGHSSIALPPGTYHLSFVMIGYKKLDTILIFPGTNLLTIMLVPEEGSLDEVTVVASTRTNQTIENSPLKVEVLGATEMSEEAGIKPGNIASILGDVSGVQIQQSSTTSGNSNVRIQGLDGRYTQILRDGMPLYDGFSGGFGILTVPPLDLKQIELVKGAASTLYGGGAIGGIVNLISKNPTLKQSLDALVNYTSLSEFNANAYSAKRNNKAGYTLFAGYTNQQATDVDGDGFSDVPDISSILIHPRVFFYPGSHTTISFGYSGSFDERKGGDMQVLQHVADSIHRYYEKNTTARHTAEYLVEHTFGKNIKCTIKGTVSKFNRLINSDTYTLDAEQASHFNEASVVIPFGNDDLVAGINAVGDQYNVAKPDTALLGKFSNFTVGAFAQYSLHLAEHTIVEAGLRADNHNTYGTFVLPRIAIFHRFNDHWASRTGFGIGYKTPNPLVQQTMDYNPLSLVPVSSSVRPEIAYGYNAEVNYKKELGDKKSLFINQAFFLTRINDPILFVHAPAGTITLKNATAPIISKGFDTYVKLELKDWELYLGYTFTDARNMWMPTGRTYVPLTPANRCAFVLVKEIEPLWRFGLEGSYVGNQYRYDGTTTPGYFFMAAMVQRNFGAHVSLVLNGENLLDYRMSTVEPLYTGSITSPVFKPLWAPIDGRVINLSIRWKL